MGPRSSQVDFRYWANADRQGRTSVWKASALPAVLGRIRSVHCSVRVRRLRFGAAHNAESVPQRALHAQTGRAEVLRVGGDPCSEELAVEPIDRPRWPEALWPSGAHHDAVRPANCQPSIGSKRSKIILAGPSTPGLTRTVSCVVLPGGTVAVLRPLKPTTVPVMVRETRRNVYVPWPWTATK